MVKKNFIPLGIASIFMVVVWAVAVSPLVTDTNLKKVQDASGVRVVSIDNADLVFEGNAWDGLGSDVEYGDFDGDDLLDLIFKRHGKIIGGKAPIIHFFLGKSLKEMTGTHFPDEADFSIQMPDSKINLDTGDFNGDSKDDLLISWLIKDRKKCLYVVLSGEELLKSGTKELTSLPKVEVMSSSKDNFYGGGDGPLKAYFFDWNGDGRDDLVIFDYNADDHREGRKLRDVGKIFVIYGSADPPSNIDVAKQSDLTFIGEKPNMCLGEGRFEDINGDKIFEYIEGGIFTDGIRFYSLKTTGTAKRVLGKEDASLFLRGNVNSFHFDDFDGDGLKDLIIYWPPTFLKSKSKVKYTNISFFLGKHLKEMTGTHTLDEADFSFIIPYQKTKKYRYLREATGDFNGDGKADLFLLWIFSKSQQPSRLDLFLSDEKFLQPGSKDVESLPGVKMSSSSFPDDLHYAPFDVTPVEMLKLFDLDRDGRDDLLLFDMAADIYRKGKKIKSAGKVFVLFGMENPPATLDLATQSDLIIEGNRRSGWLTRGYLLTADINADGIYDLLFTDDEADVYRDGKRKRGAGKLFVFFGRRPPAK